MTDKDTGDSPKAPAGRENRRHSPWPLVIVVALPLLSAVLRLPIWVTLLLLIVGTGLLFLSPHLAEKHVRDPRKAWAQLMASYIRLQSAYVALRESPSDAAVRARFSELVDKCQTLLNSRPDSDWGADSAYVAQVKSEITAMSASASVNGGSLAPAPREEIGKLADLMRQGLMADNEFKAFSARFKVLPPEKARATVEKIGELLLRLRDGAMTPANYHAALWSLLDKLDRGESDATLKPANPARPGREPGRADAGAAQGPAQGQDSAPGSVAGMKITVEEVGPDRLTEYARIPVAFEVQKVLRVESPGPGELGFRLVEGPVSQPYVKDYDASDDPDGRVLGWPKHFDVSNWGFLVAHDGNEIVGAATVALRTPAVHTLEDRSGLAVLWDLRVRPERRRQGIGTSLFWHAAEWALSKGCRQMKVETQNTNVPACRFYARQGCVLGGINQFGYAARPAAAHETMLLWYLDLAAATRRSPVSRT